MQAESSGTPEELNKIEHFLVEHNGELILAGVVERYNDGHEDWAEVRDLFEQGYAAKPLRAVAVRRKGAADSMLASEFGGIITMQIELDGS